MLVRSSAGECLAGFNVAATERRLELTLGMLQRLLPRCRPTVANDVARKFLHPGQHRRFHQLAGQCGLCRAHRLGPFDDQAAAA